MSERKSVAWFRDDPQPNTFFSRSPFRSWKFLASTAVVTVLFVAFGIIVVAHWQGFAATSSRFFWVGFMFIVGVLYPYADALRYHGRINELYSTGKINRQPDDSALNDVLEVADDAINTGLFQSSAIAGILVLMALGVALGWRPN
jgi:hypothetical protein